MLSACSFDCTSYSLFWWLVSSLFLFISEWWCRTAFPSSLFWWTDRELSATHRISYFQWAREHEWARMRASKRARVSENESKQESTRASMRMSKRERPKSWVRRVLCNKQLRKRSIKQSVAGMADQAVRDTHIPISELSDKWWKPCEIVWAKFVVFWHGLIAYDNRVSIPKKVHGFREIYCSAFCSMNIYGTILPWIWKRSLLEMANTDLCFVFSLVLL